MPYIITTTDTVQVAGPFGAAWTLHPEQTHAVATFSEAKDYLQPIVRAPADRCVRSRLVSAVRRLEATGGSIDMPNGTVCKVHHVKWDELRVLAFARRVPADGPIVRFVGDHGAPIIDAYNAGAAR